MQSMSQSYARLIPEALYSLISREVTRVVVESALLRFRLTRPNSWFEDWRRRLLITSFLFPPSAHSLSEQSAGSEKSAPSYLS